MEQNAFFSAQEKVRLAQLYRELLKLSGNILYPDDCKKLKTYLLEAARRNLIQRNVFGMNPILNDMETALIVASEIGLTRGAILGIMVHTCVRCGYCTPEDVEREFGVDVAGIIKGLNRILELYEKNPSVESENFRSLLLSFAEDMDMLIRMVGYCCDFGRKYRVVQIPANCCWTEVPPTLKVLYRQRVRWGHGLIQTFVRHRRFLFNWKYRQLGMVTLPYVLIFECLAPVIEFFGLLTFLYQALTGVVNWKTAVVIFLGLYAFCISLSLVVLFYDYSLGGSFRKVKSYLWIIGAAILEPFLYHPLIVVFSIKGYCNFLLNKKAVWGEMSRKGFAGSKKKEKSGEREKGGES